MPDHKWGDKDFDWAALADCEDILHETRKWGRLGGQIKEKYGTLRWYVSFGHLSLHSLFYPGYVYNQFPKWLWNLDCKHISPFLQFFFEKPFIWWQRQVYSHAYWKCLKKHPHIWDEIVSVSDFPEFIRGLTRVETYKGKKWKTHIIGPKGETVSTWVNMGVDDEYKKENGIADEEETDENEDSDKSAVGT